MAKKKIKTSKSKTEKPPPIDKLIVPVISVIVVFVAYYFMKGLSAEIPRVDVEDELALREVFFGEGEGKNYVVLCNTPPEEGAKSIPISSVFQDSMYEYVGGVDPTKTNTKFVLMDCQHTLPSNKTIAKRFGLNLNKRPTIFVGGKVGEPKQLPDKHLKTGQMLTKVLKSMLEPHAAKIETTKDLKAKCLNKDFCALLLKGGTPQQYVKDAIKNLLNDYPDVQFASVDTTTLLVSTLEELIPEYVPGQHRFVLFQKVSGGLESGKDGKQAEGRLITSISYLDEEKDGSLGYSSINNIINMVKKGSRSMKKLSTLPQIKTRTKKMEEQLRQKRDRASKPKSSQQQTTPPGSFTENDGSKEGRKAERDRRREEHRKNNPNYRERTPEEIAEVERQRRQRMAEEAEKWNVMEEDAPPEGDPVEDTYDDFFEDGDEEEYVEDLDDEEEEDEDVMDLD